MIFVCRCWRPRVLRRSGATVCPRSHSKHHRDATDDDTALSEATNPLERKPMKRKTPATTTDDLVPSRQTMPSWPTTRRGARGPGCSHRPTLDAKDQRSARVEHCESSQTRHWRFLQDLSSWQHRRTLSSAPRRTDQHMPLLLNQRQR